MKQKLREDMVKKGAYILPSIYPYYKYNGAYAGLSSTTTIKKNDIILSVPLDYIVDNDKI